MTYPYVAGAVLLASDLNTDFAAKTDLAMVQNAQTGTTYTFVLADRTKLVTLSNASAVAVTVPLEVTVAWPTGTQLRLLNQGAGTVTVAGAVGVTINGTPLTLAQYKGAVLTKTGTNTWTFLPFSGGSAPAVISSTTGSPTITTVGSATIYTFTGDGTIVVGTAGAARLALVGGGGGGGGGYYAGGGGGGQYDGLSSIDLAAGTITIKIGAAGAGAAGSLATATAGGTSYGMLSTGNAIVVAGGGRGGSYDTANPGGTGASGGGGNGNFSSAGGAATVSTVTGSNGGSGIATTAGGGGGGSTTAGSNATANTGGNGGAGSSDSISGTATVYAGGGGGGGVTTGGTSQSGGTGGTSGGGTNATANRGGGGGGTGGGNGTGGNGGSGVFILRVG